jgi:voltage-gated potassium channel Kch
VLLPIAFGFLLGTLSMAIHALGTAWLLQRQRGRYAHLHYRSGAFTLLSVIGLTMAVLTGLHVLQITLWALAYLWVPGITALAGLEEAIYFSVVTFTTVGYGDVVVDRHWRLMAGIEALNGILLMGWSTAVLISVAQRFWQPEPDSKA